MRIGKIPRNTFRVIFVSIGIAVLTGCVAPATPLTDSEPVPVQVTSTQSLLLELPLPKAPVPIAVYGFEDKTGQFKPQENVQTLSRAVSQGGDAILIKALRDAGNGGWFKVLERTGLDNLLKERKIIREMRSRYLGEKEFNPNALPPLLFAGVILEGGVVGFDSNTLTGGVGARFLSIGGDVKYRQNSVTVNLRAVSVKSGEVLANVTIAKTVASIGLQGGVFKYVSFDELLELETGITNNEPDTLALRRTIEKAVHSLIIEGSEAGLWEFADSQTGAALVAARRAEQYGNSPPPSKVTKSMLQTTKTTPTAVTSKPKAILMKRAIGAPQKSVLASKATALKPKVAVQKAAVVAIPASTATVKKNSISVASLTPVIPAAQKTEAVVSNSQQAPKTSVPSVKTAVVHAQQTADVVQPLVSDEAMSSRPILEEAIISRRYP